MLWICLILGHCTGFQWLVYSQQCKEEHRLLWSLINNCMKAQAQLYFSFKGTYKTETETGKFVSTERYWTNNARDYSLLSMSERLGRSRPAWWPPCFCLTHYSHWTWPRLEDWLISLSLDLSHHCKLVRCSELLEDPGFYHWACPACFAWVLWEGPCLVRSLFHVP